MTPSWPKYTKVPPQTGGSSYLLIEKRLKQLFKYKNLKQDIIPQHFVRNRSRKINIFTSGHFELCLFKVSWVILAPQPSGLGLRTVYNTVCCQVVVPRVASARVCDCPVAWPLTPQASRRPWWDWPSMVGLSADLWAAASPWRGADRCQTWWRRGFHDPASTGCTYGRGREGPQKAWNKNWSSLKVAVEQHFWFGKLCYNKKL